MGYNAYCCSPPRYFIRTDATIPQLLGILAASGSRLSPSMAIALSHRELPDPRHALRPRGQPKANKCLIIGLKDLASYFNLGQVLQAILAPPDGLKSPLQPPVGLSSPASLYILRALPRKPSAGHFPSPSLFPRIPI